MYIICLFQCVHHEILVYTRKCDYIQGFCTFYFYFKGRLWGVTTFFLFNGFEKKIAEKLDHDLSYTMGTSDLSKNQYPRFSERYREALQKKLKKLVFKPLICFLHFKYLSFHGQHFKTKMSCQIAIYIIY